MYKLLFYANVCNYVVFTDIFLVGLVHNLHHQYCH